MTGRWFWNRPNGVTVSANPAFGSPLFLDDLPNGSAADPTIVVPDTSSHVPIIAPPPDLPEEAPLPPVMESTDDPSDPSAEPAFDDPADG